MVGILGFAVASALGGGAWNDTSLFAARGLQGVFGALLAPASLSLLSVLFVDAKERAKAFGVYGAIAGGGAALGLVLGGVLASTLIGAGFIGAVFFVSLYFQIVLGYTPLQSGVRSLPLSGGVVLAAGIASALLPRLGPKPIMAFGGVVAAIGMILLTRIGLDTSYGTHVAPAMVILGFGLGCTFVPLGNIALVGVDPHDAGAASAVVNASQQVGGSLGTALLNTVAITTATAYFTDHLPATPDPGAAKLAQAQSMVHGYVTAFWWGSALLVVTALVVIVFIKASKNEVPADGAAVHIG